MKTQSLWIAAAALAGFAVLASPASAEVSAETDAGKNYLRMVFLSNASVRNVRIWSVGKTKTSLHPLNPAGDLNGDLWPVTVETAGPQKLPWVAWSRFSGVDYDIAFARWDRARAAWTPIGWVGPATAGDDLSPSLALDFENRPHLVWWRNEGGVGRVYLSIWLATQWMQEFPVSDAGEDSVNPTVTVLSDSRIQIQYDTPVGRVTRIVSFSRPLTITDDITPFGRLAVDETTTVPIGER